MSGFRVDICGRAYEGDYGSLPDAVFGALLKDRNDTNNIVSEQWHSIRHAANCPLSIRLGRGSCTCDAWRNYRIAATRIEEARPQHTIQVDTVPNVSPKKIHRVA